MLGALDRFIDTLPEDLAMFLDEPENSRPGLHIVRDVA